MSDKQRLFVDMDGTLAVFTPVRQLEELYEPGYFAKLEPIPNVVEAVKELIRSRPGVEVHILSAVLTDSPTALKEKQDWLDRYLPEIPPERRLFPPCGADKKDYITQGVGPTDFLLDDYTHNLDQWQPPARGIKLLNGINHTKGSWTHDRIRCDRAPAELAAAIVEVMQGRAQIRDERPERITPSVSARLRDAGVVLRDTQHGLGREAER